MSLIEKLAASASIANANLVVGPITDLRGDSVASDALFQVPLLALAILMIAHRQREGIQTTDVSRVVLSTLVERSISLRGLRHRIAWSVPLRSRCTDALVLLEDVGLVSVTGIQDRTVSATEDGKGLARDLLKSPTERGALARSIVLAYHAHTLKGSA